VANRYSRFLKAEIAPYLRSRSKKPWHRQVKELRALWDRYDFPPYHYFKHRLYEREAPAEVLDYVPPEIIGRFQRAANPRAYMRIVSDKLETNRILAEHGLPCVATLFSITRSGAILNAVGQQVSADAAVASLHRRDGEVFIKPIDSGVGKGALAKAVESVNLEFFETTRNVVVQPLMQNHPALSRLFAGSLNTIRIDTLVDGEHCIVNAACLKVGTGDSRLDNWGRPRMGGPYMRSIRTRACVSREWRFPAGVKCWMSHGVPRWHCARTSL
jgi:Sugar-transfer associated ATP-grasp